MKNEFSKYEEKNFLILSGDRHISEFSKISLSSKQKIYEFTSSGLTHSWSSFSGEKNRYRVNKVYSGKSFGTLSIDWNTSPNTISLKMHDIENKVVSSIIQKLK